MSKLMELAEEYGRAMEDVGVPYSGGPEMARANALLADIALAVQELEREAARHAHIISRITQSELETVIRREHDDDGEYTAGLVQMIDAAMEADK